MMIKHVMLLKVYENDESDDNIDQLREELLAVAEETGGLVSAEFGYNCNVSTDFDVAFIISFKNPTALRHFYGSEKYKNLEKFIDSVSTKVSIAAFMTAPENTITREESEEKKVSTTRKSSSKNSKVSSKSGQKGTSKTKVAASDVEDISSQSDDIPSSKILPVSQTPAKENPLPQAPAKEYVKEEVATKVEEPVAKVEEAVTKVEEPVAKVEETVTKVEEPVAKVEEPVAKVVMDKPVVPVTPVAPAAPVAKVEEPVEETVAKVEEPVEEPVAQFTKTVAHIEEPVAPVAKTVAHIEEPVAPVVKTVAHIEEPVANVEETVAHAEEEPKETVHSSKFAVPFDDDEILEPYYAPNTKAPSNVTVFPNLPKDTAPVAQTPVDEKPVAPVKPQKPVQFVTEINEDEPVAKAPEQTRSSVMPHSTVYPHTPVQSHNSASANNTASAQPAKHITYAPIDTGSSMTDTDDYDTAPSNKKKVVIDDDEEIIRIEPKGKQIKDGEFAMESAWKCPTCGKINGEFVGICGCGTHIPEFYTPLSNEEVAEARLSEAPEAETDNLMVYGHNMVAPSMNDLVNTFKPVVTKTVKAIKRSVSDDYEDPDDKEVDNHVTAAQRAAANLSPEDMVDTKRIEPKGTQIKDGESAMNTAWKCPLCGKINGGFVGICGCGAHIPENYTPVPPEEIEIQSVAKKDAIAKKDADKKTVSKKSFSKKSNTKSADGSESSLKNITSSITKTITDAMNTSLSEDLPAKPSKFSKAAKSSKSSKTKKAAYNEKLLNNSMDDTKTVRIEPKGSAPINGESAMANSWTCPTCGKINAKYIGKCGCGTYKDGDEEEFA